MRLAVRAHDLLAKGEQALIDAYRMSGVEGLQLVCYKSFPEVRHEPGGISESVAQRIGDRLSSENIPVLLLGAYFNPVHSSEQKTADGAAIFEDYLRLGQKLGCLMAGSETGSRSDEPWIYHPENRTKESFDRVVNTFSSLCKTAQRYGSTVCIEGASGHVMYNVATLQRACDAIGQENLRIIFDLYNFLDGDNCRDYYDILCQGIETFGSRIHCFHMKDCVFQPGGFRQVPLGQGELNFSRILKAIRRHNEDAILILEGTTGADIPAGAAQIRKKWRESGL